MFKNKQRWKNYGLWLAIIALIPMLTDALASYNIFVRLPDNFELLVKSILSILILAGIVNDPNTTDSTGYIDDDLDGDGIPDRLQ